MDRKQACALYDSIIKAHNEGDKAQFHTEVKKLSTLGVLQLALHWEIFYGRKFNETYLHLSEVFGN